MVERVFWPEWV